MSFSPESVRVGFQGSHRTGARVIIYSRRPEKGPAAIKPQMINLFERDDLLVTSVATQNVLGQGGTFQITFHCAPSFDPLLYIDTDAWVDVSFMQDNVEYHTMRGTIDEIRFNQQISGSGATSQVCNISGSSFQKCYATTPLWFNRYALENVGNGLLFEKFGIGQVTGSPAQNIRFFLFFLFQLIGDAGRSNFTLPVMMPRVRKSTSAQGVERTVPTLDATVNINTRYFDDTFMQRQCPTANQFFPDVDLWTMAMAFGDLQFQELFTDIYPAGGYAAYAANPDSISGLSPYQSEMTVMFRDKPFPSLSPDARPLAKTGELSPYFTDLPLHKCTRGEILSLGIGISSLESFNAFMASDALIGNSSNHDFSSNLPVWSPDDMTRRGMRRMPASSMYSPVLDAANAPGILCNQMRAKLRDFYCLGAEYRQGSISFACPKLNLRIGSRLQISGPTDTDLVTFYIEAVRHEWSSAGVKSQADVTRGYKGTINDHLTRLASVIDKYELATDQNLLGTVVPTVGGKT